MSKTLDEVYDGYLYPIITSLQSIDIFKKCVQYEQSTGRNVTGTATLLFSVWPVLQPAKGMLPGGYSLAAFTQPIGAVQNYSIQVGGQNVRLEELGSVLKRSARGVSTYSASMSRPVNSHSDLKWSCYSYLTPLLKDDTVELGQFPGLSDTLRSSIGNSGGSIFRHFSGLDSELLKYPFGLLAISGTAGGDITDSQYLEVCSIPSRSYGTQPGSPVDQENISILITSIKPLVDSQNAELFTSNGPNGIKLKASRPYFFPGA